MKALLLSLFITASACAETLVIPVQDLLFEIPQFTNAPDFNLNAALNGSFVPETPKRMDRKTAKQLEKRLINMLWDEYPDAQSIRIWNGSVIIRLPN
jgi:hypothetical protein